MKEIAPTRREVLGNSPNKPETIRSIETLQRIGVLMPMRDLDLYHGRSGNGENWVVREVNNAGNATGNRNINQIPALNTGKIDVASDFARIRTKKDREKGVRTRAEIHKIVSADPDASIFDKNFRWDSLSKFERDDARKAIYKTLPSVFEGSPLQFEERSKVRGLKMDNFLVDRKYGGYIGAEMIDNYAKRYNLPRELTTQICGAINARLFLANYPQSINKIVGAFTENTGEAEIDGVTFPINKEYVATWLKKMHVVGEKMGVRSVTLNGRAIDNYVLFDFERVNTETEVEKRIKERNKRFGKLAMAMAFNKNNRGNSERKKLEIDEALDNPYATPRQIVDAAKRVPGFRGVFESDVGNWEGFSLGEHTETVLENFEYNYADRMPVDLLPLMKLSLLVHDIGKPEAAAHGEKNEQEKYNIFHAERFMQAIHVGDREREFVLRMIGPGKTLMEKFMFRGKRREDLEELKKFSANTYQRYTGKKANDWDAHGVYTMILALQTCDSAAYTSMALTRAKEQPGVVYRNANAQFEKNFEGKRGIIRRRARIK